MILICSAWNL